MCLPGPIACENFFTKLDQRKLNLQNQFSRERGEKGEKRNGYSGYNSPNSTTSNTLSQENLVFSQHGYPLKKIIFSLLEHRADNVLWGV